MRLALVAALALAGCAPSMGLPASPGDPLKAVLAEVVEAWRADPTLEPLGACAQDVARLRIVYQSAARFRQTGWCPVLADGTCGECHECKQAWLDRRARAIYLAPGERGRGYSWAVADRALHWLAWCVGRGLEDWWGTSDPRLWGPQGVLFRSQGL